MIVITTVVILAALFAPRLIRTTAVDARFARAESWLGRFGAFAVGTLSLGIVWWVWGEVVPTPVIVDEHSYLLQADIFARGRWTVPSPPLPEFFEQPHVIVVPALASKYPPGHALLLAIGALVGFPPLLPLLFAAATGALLFALVARLTNPWVALLAWVVWISMPLTLSFQASYYSEVTTSALLLGAWWSLLEWRKSGGGRRRWLLLLALAIGWGAITRPLTMLVFAIPIGVVVIRDVIRAGRWRDFGLAAVLALGVLAILPLWSARTTGDWKLWPVELYRRDYMPYDKLGFTADTTRGRRDSLLSPVGRVMNAIYRGYAKQYRLDALPEIVGRRTVRLALETFAGERLPLLVFALIGLFAGVAFQFAALSALLLFLAYLGYPQPPAWTVYYLETTPVMAALTAAGVWRVARRGAGSDRAGGMGVAFVAVALALIEFPRVRASRQHHRQWSYGHRAFAEQLTLLPSQPAILFVKYSPRVLHHVPVVRNSANLDAQPVWVVHDRGARNAELLRLAPGRTAHYFDEDEIIGAAPANRSAPPPRP